MISVRPPVQCLRDTASSQSLESQCRSSYWRRGMEKTAAHLTCLLSCSAQKDQDIYSRLRGRTRKKIRKHHPCFLGPGCNQAKHGPEAEGQRVSSSAGLARSRGCLSWAPFRLRAHTCADSKGCGVSKDTLGKPSAYL